MPSYGMPAGQQQAGTYQRIWGRLFPTPVGLADDFLRA